MIQIPCLYYTLFCQILVRVLVLLLVVLVVLVVLVTGGKQSQLLVRLGLNCRAWTRV